MSSTTHSVSVRETAEGYYGSLVLKQWGLTPSHSGLSADSWITYSPSNGTMSTPNSKCYRLELSDGGVLRELSSGEPSYIVEVKISEDPQADDDRNPKFEALPHRWK
jgi:hypothetical protein